MTRVRCPECDKLIRVPEDYERASIRCPSCEYRVRLDDDDELEPPKRERSNKEAVKVKEPKFPNQSAPERHSSRSGAKTSPKPGKQTFRLNLIPLVLFVPVGLLLLALTPFSRLLGEAGAIGGFVAFLVGMIGAFVMIVSKGSGNEFSDQMQAVPFLLRGGWVIFLVQIRQAFSRPKTVGPWVALEFSGLLVCFSCAMLVGFLKPPPFFGLGGPSATGNMPPPAAAAGNVPLPAPKAAPGEPAPAQVTGDPILDKALADLANPNHFPRKAAIDTFQKTPLNQHAPAVAEKLVALAASPDAHTRQAAFHVLKVWATPKEVPLLIQALDDKDGLVRTLALQGIGRLRDERAVAPVVRCLKDFFLHGEAMKTLKEMGPVAEKDLLPMLDPTSGDFTFRQAVIQVLKEIGTQQSVPALQAIAAANDVFLSGHARQALTAIAARAAKGGA